MQSKKQYNETLLEIQLKMPVEHCVSVLLKKTCQVFEVNTKLKKHTYMEVTPYRTKPNLKKFLEGKGGGEKKRGGGWRGGGVEKQDVFSSICFLLIIGLPQNC